MQAGQQVAPQLELGRVELLLATEALRPAALQRTQGRLAVQLAVQLRELGQVRMPPVKVTSERKRLTRQRPLSPGEIGF